MISSICCWSFTLVRIRPRKIEWSIFLFSRILGEFEMLWIHNHWCLEAAIIIAVTPTISHKSCSHLVQLLTLVGVWGTSYRMSRIYVICMEVCGILKSWQLLIPSMVTKLPFWLGRPVIPALWTVLLSLLLVVDLLQYHPIWNCHLLHVRSIWGVKVWFNERNSVQIHSKWHE